MGAFQQGQLHFLRDHVEAIANHLQGDGVDRHGRPPFSADFYEVPKWLYIVLLLIVDAVQPSPWNFLMCFKYDFEIAQMGRHEVEHKRLTS